MKRKNLTVFKSVIAIMTLIFILFSFSGCFRDYPYKGKYIELYTADIYSIPDAVGYMAHGEGACNSDIYTWEQDEYGRVLFAYCEDYSNSFFTLVICQGYDEDSVWFYPDINYVSTYIESTERYHGRDEDHLKEMTEAIYLSAKDELKSVNDWENLLT